MDRAARGVRSDSLRVSVFILIVFTVRIFLLGIPDLADPSEARFANSAARMLQSGDWVTPQIFVESSNWVPYLAKPPFHIWMTALSFKLFGISTWAARIPGALAVLVTILLLQNLLRNAFPERNRDGILIFITLPSVLGGGFASITDPILMASITGALILSYRALSEQGKGYLLFGGAFFLGIGFLTKGPISCIIPALALGSWMTFEKRWDDFRRLPWVGAGALCMLMIVPWYALAEIRTPGFLYYFFIQENIGRYLTKDFGIRFGSTHKQPYGMIVLYALAMLVPWSFCVFAYVKRTVRVAFRNVVLQDSRTIFLLCWMLSPVIFFFFARQVLATYVLPALPAASLLLACAGETFRFTRQVRFVAGACAVLTLLGIALFNSRISDSISAREVGRYIEEIHKSDGVSCARLGAFLKVPQSLGFYGRNLPVRFEKIEDKQELQSIQPDCLLVSKKHFQKKFTDKERESITVVKELKRWVVLSSPSGWAAR